MFFKNCAPSYLFHHGAVLLNVMHMCMLIFVMFHESYLNWTIMFWTTAEHQGEGSAPPALPVPRPAPPLFCNWTLQCWLRCGFYSHVTCTTSPSIYIAWGYVRLSMPAFWLLRLKRRSQGGWDNCLYNYIRGCATGFDMTFVTFGIALGYRFRTFSITLGYKIAKRGIHLHQKLMKLDGC